MKNAQIVSALHLLLVASLTTTYLAGCSSQKTDTLVPQTSPQLNSRAGAPAIEDAEIDAHIDPRLPASDRQIMHRILLQLPKTSRAHVAYFDTNGHNYANSVELKAAMNRAQPIAGSSMYRLANGRDVAFPADGRRPEGAETRSPMLSTQPTPYPNTGPYRRVLSPPGYAQASGDATIPCNEYNYPTAGEAGIVMFGGFGVSGNSADAGLTHYPAGNGDLENLAVFIKQGSSSKNGSFNYINQNQQDVNVNGYNAHLQCGQSIYMWFWVNPDGYLNVQASGYVMFPNDPNSEDVTACLGPLSASEWPHNGGGSSSGIILKRFVGLAQNGNNFNDGSKFGVDSSGNPTVYWSGTSLGRDGSNNTVVNWDNAHIVGTALQQYPTCSQASSVVKIAPATGYDASFSEYNGILNNASIQTC